MALENKKCVPCEGGIEKLSDGQTNELSKNIPQWEIQEDKLHRSFEFKNFVAAMSFVNKMADAAEEEGHHPDFCVHYNSVDVVIWTHAIGGLTENDFILAAKINQLE